MSIRTVFAHLSCSSLEVSAPWYEKLFGMPVTRRPMDGLAEWHFTDSAEVQLFEDAKHAGTSTITPRCPSPRARTEAAPRGRPRARPDRGGEALLHPADARPRPEPGRLRECEAVVIPVAAVHEGRRHEESAAVRDRYDACDRPSPTSACAGEAIDEGDVLRHRVVLRDALPLRPGVELRPTLHVEHAGREPETSPFVACL